MQAHYTLGVTLFWLGKLRSARRHLEHGIALYDSQSRRSPASRAVQDPGVACRSYSAWVLWLLGYPDQALERSREALSLAGALCHPFSVAFASGFAAMLHQFRREVHSTRERGEAAMALCGEQGFAFYLAMGTFLRGWARAEQGQADEGIAEMRQGLAAWRATGAELAQPYYRALLADAQGSAGRARAALSALADALATVDRTGERFYEAELRRLQGELTFPPRIRKRSPGRLDRRASEAEGSFLGAIDVARRQGARSLELRAVMSLSRLWETQGRENEARRTLTEAYDWFTEGFDTPDLREARTLLKRLGAARAG